MWSSELASLSERVAAWSRAMGYQVEEHGPAPGEPLTEIGGSAGHFYLEPAEFSEMSLPAVVWLYAYPTMRRVRLVGPIEGRWEVQSSDGVPFHRQFDETEFKTLLSDLNVDVA